MEFYDYEQVLSFLATEEIPSKNERKGRTRSNFIKRAKTFTLRKGILYKHDLRVLKEEDIEQVWAEVHDAQHCGVKASWVQIKERVYWLGAYDWVK